MISGKFVSAVIVAAGSGTRMGGTSKPFIKIGDKTAFELVLDAFLASEGIDEIVVVCKDKTPFEEITAGIKEKKIRYASGGATRTESVRSGIKAASRKTDIVAVHDCARPFITAENIAALLEATVKHGAAAASSKATDTTKFIDPTTKAVTTPERDNIVLVQTPQCFGVDMYTVAYAVGKKSGREFTDETTMLENAGFKVEYVECGKRNIKLTTHEDVIYARVIAGIIKNEKSKIES